MGGKVKTNNRAAEGGRSTTTVSVQQQRQSPMTLVEMSSGRDPPPPPSTGGGRRRRHAAGDDGTPPLFLCIGKEACVKCHGPVRRNATWMRRESLDEVVCSECFKYFDPSELEKLGTA